MKLQDTNKFRMFTNIIAMYLFAVMAMPLASSAQEQKEEKNEHHHYKLIDFGTFGGPNSSYFVPNPKGLVNNSGVAVGGADTSTPDPTSTFDAFLSYGFTWQDGVAHKLGALPGFNSSFAFWVSNDGHVVGVSENGIDPLTGFRALEAVLWGKDGSITDLGTLGGNQSNAFAVNNRGQVAGAALNTIPDPYTANFIIGSSGTTQAHAFRWTKSQGMQDLGTLGGADSAAFYINDRGQIAGYSFTDSTVNPNTGVPTTHPFLWENGKMTDLGTLGGSFAGPFGFESFGGLNNRGEVVGTSNLAGDLTNHPFLWTKSGGMKDLGTLGGTFGFAAWINDAGEVVGTASTPGDQFLHAFLWRDGIMTDLGTPGSDPNTQPRSINSRGQVVGGSFDSAVGDLHGFLWENGSIADVNTLIASGSGATIIGAFDINDRGEVAATGFDANGDQRAFLLIPCDENHEDVEGCDYEPVDAVTEASVRSAQIVPAQATASEAKLSPAENMARLRALMASHNRRFGMQQASPK
jgi:probable HAF family extracellular repeat protein